MIGTAHPNPTDPTVHLERSRRIAQRLLDLGETCIDRLEKDTILDPAARATAYDILSRALRRNLLMVDRLDREPAPKPAPAPHEQRTAARAHIIRRVEDTIDTRTRDPADAERLHGELLERLEDPELDDDIDTRPIDVIVAEIIRDLGFYAGQTRGKRRTPDDLATMRARAAAHTPAQTTQTPTETPAEAPALSAFDDPEIDRSLDPTGVLASLLRRAGPQPDD